MYLCPLAQNTHGHKSNKHGEERRCDGSPACPTHRSVNEVGDQKSECSVCQDTCRDRVEDTNRKECSLAILGERLADSDTNSDTDRRDEDESKRHKQGADLRDPVQQSNTSAETGVSLFTLGNLRGAFEELVEDKYDEQCRPSYARACTEGHADHDGVEDDSRFKQDDLPTLFFTEDLFCVRNARVAHLRIVGVVIRNGQSLLLVRPR